MCVQCVSGKPGANACSWHCRSEAFDDNCATVVAHSVKYLKSFELLGDHTMTSAGILELIRSCAMQTAAANLRNSDPHPFLRPQPPQVDPALQHNGGIQARTQSGREAGNSEQSQEGRDTLRRASRKAHRHVSGQEVGDAGRDAGRQADRRTGTRFWLNGRPTLREEGVGALGFRSSGWVGVRHPRPPHCGGRPYAGSTIQCYFVLSICCRKSPA